MPSHEASTLLGQDGKYTAAAAQVYEVLLLLHFGLGEIITEQVEILLRSGHVDPILGIDHP